MGVKYLTCKTLFIRVKFPSCIHKYVSYERLWACSILEICAECVHHTCYCDFHIDLNSGRERVIWYYMNLMHIITPIAFLFFKSIALRYFYTLLEIRPNALYTNNLSFYPSISCYLIKGVSLRIKEVLWQHKCSPLYCLSKMKSGYS